MTLTTGITGGGGLLPTSSSKFVQRSVQSLQVSAVVSVERDTLRAALAREALVNTADLAALEGTLIKMVPLGELRYQAIVDAYAVAAANSVARFQ